MLSLFDTECARVCVRDAIIPQMCESVRSRIARDLGSASTQSAGARFHPIARFRSQEHTGGSSGARIMCQYVSTLWHATARSGTRLPCASPQLPSHQYLSL